MSLLIFVKVLKGEGHDLFKCYFQSQFSLKLPFLGGVEWSIPSRCRGELSDPATLRHFPLAGAL